MALKCDLNLPAKEWWPKKSELAAHEKNGLEMVTGLGGLFQTVLNRIQNYNVWNGLLDWIKVNKTTHSVRCEQRKPDLDSKEKRAQNTVHTHMHALKSTSNKQQAILYVHRWQQDDAESVDNVWKSRGKR